MFYTSGKVIRMCLVLSKCWTICVNKISSFTSSPTPVLEGVRILWRSSKGTISKLILNKQFFINTVFPHFIHFHIVPEIEISLNQKNHGLWDWSTSSIIHYSWIWCQTCQKLTWNQGSYLNCSKTPGFIGSRHCCGLGLWYDFHEAMPYWIPYTKWNKILWH